MEAGLQSRKRKHQSLNSDVIFARSKSQIHIHRHRYCRGRPDSIPARNIFHSLEGTKKSVKSLVEQEAWGCTVDQVTSEVSVKDLRARRVFSPTTTDEVVGDGEVDLEAGLDVHKTNGGNPNASFEGDAGHGDLGVSGSVVNDLKPSTENNVDSFVVGENNAMEADEFVKMTPIVTESDQKKGIEEENVIISVANEIVDTKAYLSKSQPSVTNLRGRKKVFISPKSYSYRRLLPYLMDQGTDDSSHFEMVKPTLPEVKQSSNMVPNMAASKDKEIDAVPNYEKQDSNSGNPNLTKTVESSGLPDLTQKSNEDVLIDTSECEQMTPPDSDIYSKPLTDKSAVLVKPADSISSSKLVLKPCSRMKKLQIANSHGRLLPFLMSVAENDSCALKSNQSSKPEKALEQIQQSLLDDSNINSISTQTIIADEKSNSPTSTLTPIDRTPTDLSLVSNDNLLETDNPNGSEPESTSQLEVKVDSSTELEQESPKKDLYVVESTSKLEIVPNTNNVVGLEKNHNKDTHESLQIAPVNFGENIKNGILKRTPRGCRGICNCLNCTSFRLHAERSSEFSRNQLHDAEEVALELINDLTSLKNILETTASHSKNLDKQVKEVCAKALYKEEVARARLTQMNEDLSFHIKSMKLLRPKVTFAHRTEEKSHFRQE